MANKFFNKRSAVVIDGLPKLPTPDSIEYGEIAINYADGVETISIKNSANEIVEFKTKEYFEQIIEENEKVIAKALNDVDERIIELTPRVDDLFLTVDALPIVTDRDGSKFLGDDGVYHTIEFNGGVDSSIVEELNEFKQNVEESEKVIAKILNDVDERCYGIEDNVNSISRDVDDLKTIVEEGQAVTAASIYQMNERCYSIEDNVNSISRDVDDLNSRFDNIGQHTVIQNLTTTISTLQQTIAELQTEITNIKNELNKTLTIE